MSHEPAAPETKGVAVETLAMVDLAREIEGTAGRQLRMRHWLENRGAIPAVEISVDIVGHA